MKPTFRDLIAANKRNSVLLVLGFIVFITLTAFVFTLAIYSVVNPEAVLGLAWSRAMLIGAVVAVVLFFVSFLAYYEGANFIMAVSGAKPLEKRDDPQLFNVVEEMAIAAGLPMPQIYLIDNSAPNAFATGRDPQHALIAITTGLREKLTRDELQGVIAHEMSHIRNYDIRLMLLMAVLVGTIVMLADFFQQLLFRGPRRSSYYDGGSSNSSSDSKADSKGSAILVLVLVVGAVILAILAPILARIIQFAVSRQREFLADASAVELTRNPLGLASALRKIDDDPEELEAANRGTAHLFIANPIKKFESWSDSMFASHPPIKERIARLEMLAQGAA